MHPTGWPIARSVIPVSNTDKSTDGGSAQDGRRTTQEPPKTAIAKNMLIVLIPPLKSLTVLSVGVAVAYFVGDYIIRSTGDYNPMVEAFGPFAQIGLGGGALIGAGFGLYLCAALIMEWYDAAKERARENKNAE